MNATSPGRFAGLARPPAILCIGRNYADHAGEMGSAPPERPMVFMKNPAAVVADGDTIVIPAICREHGPQVDYEGEVAVVLGSDLVDGSEDEAAAAIAGYAAANDVSARWWQKEGAGGQFIRGKSFDTFCPIGPMADATGVDPTDLRVRTRIGDESLQDGSTRDLIFPVVPLLAELSRGTTLLAGTVILTGTPAGVGHARTPRRYLTGGDVVEVTVMAADGRELSRVSNPVTEA